MTEESDADRGGDQTVAPGALIGVALRGTICRALWRTTFMPRKPNYDFERRDRDKAKAAKKEERVKAKAERKTESVTREPEGSAPPRQDDQ